MPAFWVAVGKRSVELAAAHSTLGVVAGRRIPEVEVDRGIFLVAVGRDVFGVEAGKSAPVEAGNRRSLEEADRGNVEVAVGRRILGVEAGTGIFEEADGKDVPEVAGNRQLVFRLVDIEAWDSKLP